MSAESRRDVSSWPSPSARSWLLGGLIVAAICAAYANSLTGPFVFDDGPAIVDNPTLRTLWPISRVLHPPGGLTVEGRPVVNLTLALNYAWGKTAVGGYHAVNLGIHVLAALTLFGLVRRTLQTPLGGGLSPERAALTAAAAALLWALHPLQTESVTYTVQRAEALMALCYLLTLYCFLRSCSSPRSAGWAAAAVTVCLLGMACKEVMVSAPLLVLLYDRTFVSGSFRQAWHRHGRLHLTLAATWILLAVLVLGMGGQRGGTAGFGLGISSGSYALTQCAAIIHYLRLCFWPQPLVFDYGTAVITDLGRVLPQALLLAALLLGTVLALRHRPVVGFLATGFFLVLAPTSSFLPVATQTMAEHRMYLPLAALAVPAAFVLQRWAGRSGLVLALLAAVALGALTLQRNRDYRSALALWSDTAAKLPSSPRALYNVGVELAKLDRLPDAIAHYRSALSLKPDYPEAHYNLGNALFQSGAVPEAIRSYESALRFKPDYAKAHYNLGVALLQSGQTPQAATHLFAAVRLAPGDAEAHGNLGVALYQLGRPAEAVVHLQEAARLQPDAKTCFNLGTVLLELGRRDEAVAQFEEALRLNPEHAAARSALSRLQANRMPAP
jgi:Flp pilus assembly protein TadD